MGLLDNKVCVVTGGSGSVGLASARAFLREGGKVMVVDLREADVKRAVDGLKSPNAAGHVADVADAAQTKAYIDATVAKWGKIDVLFSNAGNPGKAHPLTDYPEDVFDRTLAIHAKGAFLAIKYALPQMNDGGSIIITSSLAGTRGCAATDPRQLAQPGADRQRVPDQHRERHQQDDRRQRHRAVQLADPAQAPWPPGRDRQCGAVPGVGYVELRDRRGDDGGWRDDELSRRVRLNREGIFWGGVATAAIATGAIMIGWAVNWTAGLMVASLLLVMGIPAFLGFQPPNDPDDMHP